LGPRLRNTLEYAVCLTVIVGVAAAALFPAIFQGKVPVSTAPIFHLPPWEDAEVSGGVDATSDSPQAELMATRYYPWFLFLNQAAQKGDSILWNPYESCGLPFLALWRTRCLSPFSVPFYLMPLATAFTASVFLKLLVAGLAAFYVARRLGHGRPIALFAAVTFELSAHLLLWWGSPISDVVPWLPLLLLFAELAALGEARTWPFGTIVVGLMLLGGDPETAVAACLFAGLFITARLTLGRHGFKATRRSLWVLIFASLGGVVLAGIQIVPHIEFLLEAADSGRPPSAGTTGFGILLGAFMPNLFASLPVGHASSVPGDLVGLLYVGLAPLVLLPLWFALRPFATVVERRRTEALLLAAALMTVLALGVGPALAGVPVLNLLRPEHLLVANALVMALAAAATAEAWLELDADDCGATVRRLVVFGPLFFAVIAGLVTVNRHNVAASSTFVWQMVVLAIHMSILLALLALTLLRPSKRLMGFSLTGLVAAELLFVFHPMMPFSAPETLFPATDTTRALEEAGARVGGSAGLDAWPLTGNLLCQVSGPSGAELKRHAAFFSRLEEDPLLVRRLGASTLILDKEDIQGPFASVRPLLHVDEVYATGAVAFRESAAMPRARAAYTGRQVGECDPSMLSSDAPPLIEGLFAPGGPPTGPGVRATIRNPGQSGNVTVDLEGSSKAALVLADAWYPGWKATVDGTEMPLFPVDVLFRGVEIGEGAKRVVFEYKPLSLKIGAALSIGACLIVFWAILGLLVQRFRASRDPWHTPT
jgi:Bacterial membrane protein YfhO